MEALDLLVDVNSYTMKALNELAARGEAQREAGDI